MILFTARAVHNVYGPLARYVKLRVAHAPGTPGTFSPPLRVIDPDMHYGTCVTHVPWCMPGSLTRGFLRSRWREKRSRHSWRMRNPHFYVSGKRPIALVWHVPPHGTPASVPCSTPWYHPWRPLYTRNIDRCVPKFDLGITLTSYKPNGVSYHRKLDCVFNILFRVTTRKDQNSVLLAFCQGNPPFNDDFPYEDLVFNVMYAFFAIIILFQLPNVWQNGLSANRQISLKISSFEIGDLEIQKYVIFKTFWVNYGII